MNKNPSTPNNLTGAELLKPRVHPVDLPEDQGGGRVYLRQPSAARVLHLLGMAEEDRKARFVEETNGLLAETVCDMEGTPLFDSAEQVGQLPIGIWTRLNTEATQRFLQDVTTKTPTESTAGEGSGETEGSDLPTGSPSA